MIVWLHDELYELMHIIGMCWMCSSYAFVFFHIQFSTASFIL